MARKKQKKSGNTEKKIVSDNERQVRWVIAAMILLVFVIFVTYFIFRGASVFDYAGITFQKTKVGSIDFFYGKIPLVDSNNQLVANYNLYLRNDPRRLTNIPINAAVDLGSEAFISFDPSLEHACTDNIIASASLDTLLRAAQVSYKVGYTNQSYAKMANASYLTCSNAVNKTGIIIQQGSVNSIDQVGNHCYVLTFKDCDIVKVTERFMIAALANSRGITV